MRAQSLTTAQFRALDAVRSWWDGRTSKACVVYGPPGCGKGLLAYELLRELTGPEVRTVSMRIGRAEGNAFEHTVLARIAAGLWPEETDRADDPRDLRHRVSNALANWDVEDDDPELILALLGIDACLDWPLDERTSALADLGPSARVIVTVSGSLEEAEAWARRLGIRPSDVAWVKVEGLTLSEVDARARERLAWAASSGPGPRAFIEGVLRGLLAQDASRLSDLVSLLSVTFGPIDFSDAANILDTGEAMLRVLLKDHRAAARALLGWEDDGRALRFRHEALRAAFTHLDEAQSSAAEERLVAASRRTARAYMKGASIPGYLRQHAGDHLLSREGAPALLGKLGNPRWAWPRSLEDLAARRAELRRARRALSAPFREMSDTDAALEALPHFTRIGLSQGALGTIYRTWAEERSPTAETKSARWVGVEPALALAYLALADQTSPPLRLTLTRRALKRARAHAEGWHDTEALLALSRVAPRDEAARYARAAVIAADHDDRRPSAAVWIDAARYLPPDDEQALTYRAIERASAEPQPGGALGSLGRTEGLHEAQALLLYQAALSLPRGARANALSPLLRLLRDDERNHAKAAILEDLKEGAEAPSENLDYEGIGRAVAPWLSLREVSSLLAASAGGMGEVLAVRLAELGKEERTIKVIAQRVGEGAYAARPLLRAAVATRAAAGRTRIKALARAVAASLPGTAALALLRDEASAAIKVLGLKASCAMVDRFSEASSASARIAALAALCRAAPAKARPRLAERAILIARKDADPDALDDLIACARWMKVTDAAWLFAVSLGDAAGSATLTSMLSGFGGIAHLAPLVAQFGGDAALAEVARALGAVRRWLAAPVHHSAAASSASGQGVGTPS